MSVWKASRIGPVPLCRHPVLHGIELGFEDRAVGALGIRRLREGQQEDRNQNDESRHCALSWGLPVIFASGAIRWNIVGLNPRRARIVRPGRPREDGRRSTQPRRVDVPYDDGIHSAPGPGVGARAGGRPGGRGGCGDGRGRGDVRRHARRRQRRHARGPPPDRDRRQRLPPGGRPRADPRRVPGRLRPGSRHTPRRGLGRADLGLGGAGRRKPRDGLDEVRVLCG